MTRTLSVGVEPSALNRTRFRVLIGLKCPHGLYGSGASGSSRESASDGRTNLSTMCGFVVVNYVPGPDGAHGASRQFYSLAAPRPLSTLPD
jgi:hypothetical protein